MIILYILALLLSFYVLAVICDKYFVESLDIIAKKLKMSSDAAGATLMAVGSSAPELFVALFAIIMPGEIDPETGKEVGNEAIGVGNIVGSAIFNILVITGAVGVVKKSKLAWRPVMRDIFFYSISVMLLISVFIIANGSGEFLGKSSFSVLDTIIFLVIYVVYVLVVIYWRKMFPPNKVELELAQLEADTEALKKEESEEDDGPKPLWKKILYPIDFVLDLIFPSLKYFYVVFFISIAFIAGISWVLVESAVGISNILHIPKAIVALTVLAVGTSVPDLFSSIIVAKENKGGMAVSNGIGSNIFDILVGLGLPFLIMMLISGKEIIAEAGEIFTSSLVLFGTVVVLLFTFIINKWKIGKGVGWFFIMLYVAYVIWQIILVVVK